VDSAQRKQFHFWLSGDDYRFLKSKADARGESMGALLRRVVRRLKQIEPASGPQRSAHLVNEDRG
jgi:hypothetical protein